MMSGGESVQAETFARKGKSGAELVLLSLPSWIPPNDLAVMRNCNLYCAEANSE